MMMREMLEPRHALLEPPGPRFLCTSGMSPDPFKRGLLPYIPQMSYNHSHVLDSLHLPRPPLTPSGIEHSRLSPRLHSSPVLLQPLPFSQSLERESLAQSELELDRQRRQVQRERELAEALQEQRWEIQRAAARDLNGTWRGKAEKGKGRSEGIGKAFVRPPQAYELYQAIDKHDIDFIMRVRDQAFGLLLQKNAGEFPIVYASRIGDSHRDVVILLVGALSR